jgi:ubiquitin-conjugating enzyme E2 J1
MNQGVGAASAIKRIQRELKEICESPSRHWTAAPVADDLFEWQFAVRGPPGTDFEGGIYSGRLVLPVNYPLAPPSITLLTPNGRWEVGKKICLSNTSYHPDLWQPAWGIRTMVEALRSHFPIPGDGAIGAIDWPSDVRQRLAKESLEFVCAPGTKRNRELLPELSPEEMKEDMPEVSPFQASAAAAAAAEGPSSAGEALPEGALPPRGSSMLPPPAGGAATAENSQSAATAENAAAQNGLSLPQGLRQRNASNAPLAGSTAPVAAAALPKAAATSAAAAALPSSPSASTMPAAGSASGAVDASAPRRRRENVQRRRPQQPLLVQIFKPPRTRRGWVLCVIDTLIGLLTISFLIVLADMIKNPPPLLNPLVDTKEVKE